MFQTYMKSDDGPRPVSSCVKFIVAWCKTGSVTGDVKDAACSASYCKPSSVTEVENAKPFVVPDGFAFVGTAQAYELGFAINRCLFAVEAFFELVMNMFEIPSNFSEWKTADAKCQQFYEQTEAAVVGLCAVGGYAAFIRKHYSMFECLVPKGASTGTAIIGDCNDEFWQCCPGTTRSSDGQYHGERRNCSLIG
jgi:hypothetical protein